MGTLAFNFTGAAPKGLGIAILPRSVLRVQTTTEVGKNNKGNACIHVRHTIVESWLADGNKRIPAAPDNTLKGMTFDTMLNAQDPNYVKPANSDFDMNEMREQELKSLLLCYGIRTREQLVAKKGQVDFNDDWFTGGKAGLLIYDPPADPSADNAYPDIDYVDPSKVAGILAGTTAIPWPADRKTRKKGGAAPTQSPTPSSFASGTPVGAQSGPPTVGPTGGPPTGGAATPPNGAGAAGTVAALAGGVQTQPAAAAADDW